MSSCGALVEFFLKGRCCRAVENPARVTGQCDVVKTLVSWISRCVRSCEFPCNMPLVDVTSLSDSSAHASLTNQPECRATSIVCMLFDVQKLGLIMHIMVSAMPTCNSYRASLHVFLWRNIKSKTLSRLTLAKERERERETLHRASQQG